MIAISIDDRREVKMKKRQAKGDSEHGQKNFCETLKECPTRFSVVSGQSVVQTQL